MLLSVSITYNIIAYYLIYARGEGRGHFVRIQVFHGVGYNPILPIRSRFESLRVDSNFVVFVVVVVWVSLELVFDALRSGWLDFFNNKKVYFFRKNPPIYLTLINAYVHFFLIKKVNRLFFPKLYKM